MKHHFSFVYISNFYKNQRIFICLTLASAPVMLDKSESALVTQASRFADRIGFKTGLPTARRKIKDVRRRIHAMPSTQNQEQYTFNSSSPHSTYRIHSGLRKTKGDLNQPQLKKKV